MRTPSYLKLIIATTTILGSLQDSDAVWITNFTSLNAGVGGSASGVWREVGLTGAITGAGTDSTFAANLTSTGEVKTTTDPTLPSRIDESFPWRSVTVPGGGTITLPDGSSFTNPAPFPVTANLPFAPGVNGDFVNVETEAGQSSVVTIVFGAQITNPVLSLSDLDTQSLIDFGGQSFTILSSTNNLGVSGNMLTNTTAIITDPILNAIFDEEAAGSIQFTGTFTQLQFTIVNSGTVPDIDSDRTGFVVSSENAPVAIPEPSSIVMIAIAGLGFILRKRR